MKVFVWERVDELTNNYHSQGGVAVFADTEDRARELVKGEGCAIKAGCAPDDVRDVDGGTEKVYIFPDAGCC